MKKLSAIALALTLIVSLFATPINVNAATKKTKLDKTNVILDIKEKTTINFTNNTKKVKWSVSKKGIIKIKKKNNQAITIQGKKRGETTLKAKVGKKTYSCKIQVDDFDECITMYAGTTKELQIAAYNSKGKLAKYTCSNNKIAKIRETTKRYVKVSALKPGTTIITGKLHPFTKKYKIEVIPELTDKEIQEWSNKIKQEFVNAFISCGLKETPDRNSMGWGGIRCHAKNYKKQAQDSAPHILSLGATQFFIEVTYEGEGAFMVWIYSDC